MITQLRIQNFKSLRDVTLDLQRVNLLIGPNNCGKTNVLKALKFFSEFLTDTYPTEQRRQTLSFRNGPQNPYIPEIKPVILMFARDDKSFGGIYLHGSYNEGKKPDYAIVGGATQNSTVNFPDDLLDLHEIESSFDALGAVYTGTLQKILKIPDNYEVVSSVRFEEAGCIVKVFNEQKSIEEGISDRIFFNVYNPDNILPAVIFTNWIHNKLYRPDPAMLLSPYPVLNEGEVADDCSNLVAFLQVMRNKHQDVYNRIVGDIRRFIPEFADISFDIVNVDSDDPIREKHGDYSYVKVGLTSKNKDIFWSEDLSEGVLYFLSLLAIIHQPKAPKLLLLEEPEKGIHPRRIREVLDLIFELAEEKDIQVIMTTHSPLVVDYFSDTPESVFILEKPENETIVKNLQRDVIEPMNKKFREAGEEPIPYTEALGEHWAMGFLGGVPYEQP